MSQADVWQESGIKGGSGFLYRPCSGVKWTFRSWNNIEAKLRPGNRLAAIQLLEKWTKEIGTQYALVQCTGCHAFHPGTTNSADGWVGHVCDYCLTEKKNMGDILTMKGGQTAIFDAKGKATSMTVKSEVNKLPKVNSPVWTEQWSVVGSAKQPYIVSHKTNGANGSTTGDGWACSCMAFTRNTPREDCEHILKVRLHEGLGMSKPVIPTGHAKEYAEWLSLKAKKARAGAVDGEVKMVGDATGRRFR